MQPQIRINKRFVVRTAVVYFPPHNGSDVLARIAGALANGLERAGHQVTVIRADKGSPQPLTSFGYVAIGAESRSFFSREPDGDIKAYLSNAGMVSGKRSFAFVRPRGLFALKTLGNLMRRMEAEGMFIRYSEILPNEASAAATAARLKVE